MKKFNCEALEGRSEASCNRENEVWNDDDGCEGLRSEEVKFLYDVPDEANSCRAPVGKHLGQMSHCDAESWVNTYYSQNK